LIKVYAYCSYSRVTRDLCSYAGSGKALEQMLATYPNMNLFSVIDFPDNQGRWF